MSYWDGSKKSSCPKKTTTVQYIDCLLASPGIEISEDLMPLQKSGSARKLTLEQEFSFQILCVSREGFPNVITWVILLSKELKLFIIWPSLARIRSTLTDCFKRLHPNVRTIIDCSEIFLTPQVHQIGKLAYGVTTSTTAQ